MAAFTGVAVKQAGKNDSVARLAGACALLLAGFLIQRLRTEPTALPSQESPAPPDSAIDHSILDQHEKTQPEG